MTITVVGLGPGDPRMLTVGAREVLDAAETVWFRTLRHPTVDGLGLNGRADSFDRVYEARDRFEDVYAEIVAQLLALAADGDVVYAVPGHPLVGEATVRGLLAAAPAAGVDVRIIDGLSFLEPVCTALGIDPLEPGVQIVDALQPRLDPVRPAIIAQVFNRRTASELKLALLDRYPAEHPVTAVRDAGTAAVQIETLPLAEIDRSEGRFNHLACLYLSPLTPEANLRSFDGLRAITHRLRAPGGCPWDREQTHASLKPFVLEETYEVLAALDADDPAALAEELGDLLLQMALHTEIAEEAGEFTYGDVFEHICAKLLRRHPHVFGDVAATSSDDAWRNWQRIKKEEKGADESILAGVPKAMPALAFAQAVQERAARVGFDWPRLDDVLDKLVEEIQELRETQTHEQRVDEFGDILFVLANVARWLNLNAEESLRLAGQKFVRRFGGIEALAHERGLDLTAMSLAEMDRLWDEVKGRENPLPPTPSSAAAGEGGTPEP
ncbi:MAG: nucleoside triphosphate pyrophosphohydrolase [Chloroflexi bacterium]|nr:nucleoside triphosphate pyrophosphohydrolase [Chloroflexota bacterium]